MKKLRYLIATAMMSMAITVRVGSPASAAWWGGEVDNDTGFWTAISNCWLSDGNWQQLGHAPVCDGVGTAPYNEDAKPAWRWLPPYKHSDNDLQGNWDDVDAFRVDAGCTAYVIEGLGYAVPYDAPSSSPKWFKISSNQSVIIAAIEC